VLYFYIHLIVPVSKIMFIISMMFAKVFGFEALIETKFMKEWKEF
jgi:hypothetical protein